MTPKVRLIVFGGGVAGLVVLLVAAFVRLPQFGHGFSAYADALNALSVPQRHITDVVTAVGLDYRSIDTLVDAFLFLAAVAAAGRVLQPQLDEGPVHSLDAAAGRWVPPTSDTVRVLGLALVGPTILFGLYIVAHGHLTPGGGFQGGVVLATGVLLVYLAGEYDHLHGLYPESVMEVGEAVGAASYVVIGLVGLIGGTAFLDNVGPLGSVGHLNSAGLVPIIDLAVGIEVAAGFVLLLSAFLRQALVLRVLPPESGAGGSR